MDTLLGIFITSFIVALSGALMPGPLLTTTIGESSRHGSAAGPLLMLGHALLELALIALLFLGLAPLLKNKTVTAIISIVGALILLWLAYGMFRSLSGLSIDKEVKPSQGGKRRLVASGILISLSNPYWTLWWASIGLAYILQARIFGIIGVAVFFVGHILADFIWYSFISLTVGKGRKMLTPMIYRGVVAVCALFLVGFAVWFLVGGIRGIGE
jgi:threonine/homoserine/homoserine lactone efflux protein